MRILTLVARFGSEQYATALGDIDTWYARQVPDSERRTVVVDNALEAGHERRVSDTCVVIGGDNREWEFSAWDRALAYVGRDVLSYDLVNLCTSAFRTLYVSYLDRIDGDLLAAVRGRALALGHIDRHPRPVRLFSYCTQHWVRTSFFFVPPNELLTLAPVAAMHCRDRIFSGDPDEPFLADAPISPAYRELVVSWLTGAGTGQGVVWHSRFALNQETLPLFEAKTVAMLNEQMLSIRLRAQGCRLVDVTWAHGVLADGGTLRGTVPDWRAQLARRPVDAVPREVTAPDVGWPGVVPDRSEPGS
jgi:hypothetical protein